MKGDILNDLFLFMNITFWEWDIFFCLQIKFCGIAIRSTLSLKKKTQVNVDSVIQKPLQVSDINYMYMYQKQTNKMRFNIRHMRLILNFKNQDLYQLTYTDMMKILLTQLTSVPLPRPLHSKMSISTKLNNRCLYLYSSTVGLNINNIAHFYFLFL